MARQRSRLTKGRTLRALLDGDWRLVSDHYLNLILIRLKSSLSRLVFYLLKFDVLAFAGLASDSATVLGLIFKRFN